MIAFTALTEPLLLIHVPIFGDQVISIFGQLLLEIYPH